MYLNSLKRGFGGYPFTLCLSPLVEDTTVARDVPKVGGPTIRLSRDE